MTILFPAVTATPIFPPHALANFNLKNPTLCFLNNPCRPPFLKSNVRSRRLLAALSPQSPQQPDPPPEREPVRRKGIAATLSALLDRVQIFFAVLFWMSLFFWASALDGKNNSSGTPNKRSKFRR